MADTPIGENAWRAQMLAATLSMLTALGGDLGGGPLGADREFVVTTYFVKTAFAGAAVGDVVTCTQVIDVTDDPVIVGTLWRNQTAAADLAGAPAGANITLVGSQALTDAQLRAAALAVTGPLTDAQMRAAPVPVSIAEVEIKNDAGNALSVQKGQQAVADAVIANGASLSGAIDLGVARLVGLSIPANIDGATTLSFVASYDGGVWNNVYDSVGAEKTVTVAPSRRVILSPADFYGIRHLKVRLGTAAAPVVNAADRTLKLIAEA